MPPSMKLLVTGGAGYIGSIVAQQLLEAGHDVVVLDNLSRGHRAAVPEGAELIELDLLNDVGLRNALDDGFDGVMHFAALALVAESVAHPERYHRSNHVGALNLLDAMREAGVRRLVFSSTCAVYGEPDQVPMREDIPAAPVNAYGNSKLAIDRMIGDECRAHGLAAASLRYFNVAGARGDLGEDHEPETHLIPLVLRAAAGVSDHVKVLRDRLPDPRRHGRARLHPRRGPRRRARHGARRRRARPPRDLQPRHRARLLGQAGRRGRPPRDRAGDPRARGAAPPRRPAGAGGLQRPASASSSAGSPAKSLDEMIADAWAWHQAHPDGYGD